MTILLLSLIVTTIIIIIYFLLHNIKHHVDLQELFILKIT